MIKSPDKRLTDAVNSCIMEISAISRKKKTDTAPVAEVKAEAPAEKPVVKTTTAPKETCNFQFYGVFYDKIEL